MAWHLAWYYGDKKAKELGNMHEDETPNALIGERNMDLWNNAMGREIAYDMKRELGEDYDLLGDEWASEYASRKIYDKMRNGELITNPNDKRKYENLELELELELWEVPNKENLDKKVQSGELIYVDNYTRSDETIVNGYYRRRPYFTNKNS